MNRLTHLLAAPASPRRRAPPRPSPCTEARRSRGWVRRCRAAFGASVALLASGAACGDDGAAPAPIIATADAGPDCAAGSEGCACVFGSGCQQGLLCIARRCLTTDATPEVTTTRPPRPPPTLPNPPEPEPPDIGSPPAPPDAGDGSSPDAGTLADASADAG